ncbi:MAG: protein kinase, partial [Verrucomicrobia bacterium]|nr:protein kinase [Verrucomicrobiota bacterium]
LARVFDGGATEAGRPYFVMELVRGVKIPDYCDGNHLPNLERLKLFIQVCHAIQHAHQKGVIHRDIKPSNVLVTLHDGVPVPKVIDFGIAKATEQRLTDKTLFTELRSFIGTPAYSSPEQAEMSGLDIDTRSDIYSLGVLLYELLTNQTPFDAARLQQSGLHEMRRIIREEEPVRPSTRLRTLPMNEAATVAATRRTQAPALAAAVSRDVDWIVMKCLEKDRNRRYETANDLATDIQRFLDSEPVLARSPSNFYRFQKFARRHRGVFAATAVVTATLLLGMGVSIWQAIRATRAEHDARNAQQRESASRQRAVQGEAAARLNEYVADINLAQRSLAAGNYGRAVQLLDKHRPQPGQPDLRGFEWRYLWQVSRGDEHLALPNQGGAVQAVAYSPDGELLVVGLADKFMVWDARTRSLLTNVPMGAVSMMFSPDGKTLITAHPLSIWGGRPGLLREMGLAPGRGNAPIPGRGPNPQRGWRDGPPRGQAAGAPLGPEDSPQPGRRPRPGVGPEGGQWPGLRAAPLTVQVWNTKDWTERKALPGNAGPVALSKDGTRLATTTTTRQGVRVWDTSTWSEVRLLTGAQGPVTFSPDGKTLAGDSAAGITLWPAPESSCPTPPICCSIAALALCSGPPVPSPFRPTASGSSPPAMLCPNMASSSLASGTRPRARKPPCRTTPNTSSTPAPSPRWPFRRTGGCSPPPAWTTRFASGTLPNGSAWPRCRVT